jgi:16S rRNA processing protein RimM
LWVRIGQVVGAHGIDGGLKIAPDSDQWRSWPEALKRVRIDRLGPEPVLVLEVRIAANRPVLRVDGVESRDAAERLRRAVIYRPGEDRSPLAEGEYYWDELTGAAVVGPDGRPLGSVMRVEPGPAHDWLVVGNVEHQVWVPFVRAWVTVGKDRTLALLRDPEPV